MFTGTFQDHIATLLTVLFLGGATADRLSIATQADPEPYHLRVRTTAQKLPNVIGDWHAMESPDPSTQAYLHANVYVSRMLTNSASGQQVYLSIIQCRDARDLIPHFPAVCYPGRGMNQIEIHPKDWDISGMIVSGTEYRFESDGFRQGNSVIVDNFMILPTGTFCRDMKEVKSLLPIRDRFFGLGQVQIVFAEGTSTEMRNSAVQEILGGHKDLIETIRSGLHP
jgi:Protein of unknown function (DUF3485)